MRELKELVRSLRGIMPPPIAVLVLQHAYLSAKPEPPFLDATAFSGKPDALVLEHRMIEGEPYDVVSDGLKQIVRTRGIKRRKRESLAESLVTVTTMPR